MLSRDLHGFYLCVINQNWRFKEKTPNVVYTCTIAKISVNFKKYCVLTKYLSNFSCWHILSTFIFIFIFIFLLWYFLSDAKGKHENIRHRLQNAAQWVNESEREVKQNVLWWRCFLFTAKESSVRQAHWWILFLEIQFCSMSLGSLQPLMYEHQRSRLANYQRNHGIRHIAVSLLKIKLTTCIRATVNMSLVIVFCIFNIF